LLLLLSLQAVGAAALLLVAQRRSTLEPGVCAVDAAALKTFGSTMGPLSVTYVCKNLCYILLQTTAASLSMIQLAAHQVGPAACGVCWQHQQVFDLKTRVARCPLAAAAVWVRAVTKATSRSQRLLLISSSHWRDAAHCRSLELSAMHCAWLLQLLLPVRF
jgi:hypothetical protein